MSVPVFTKVAKPRLLIGGNFKATCINLFAGLLVLVLVDVLVFLIQITLGQILVIYLTHRNPFFLDEREVFIRTQNPRAKDSKGDELYV